MALAGALLAGWIAFVRLAPPWLVWGDGIHAVEETAATVESFLRAQGRLPTEAEVGLTEASSTFFNVVPDGGYELGFSVGFDETYRFDPRTRRWSFDEAR